MSFDPTELIIMLSNFDQNIRIMSLNAEIINICDYCGVSFDERKIIWKGEDYFGGLNAEQKTNLKTFQDNLIHFFGYYDKFMSKVDNNNNCSYRLLNNLALDFEARAVEVFQMMAYNFATQISKTPPRNKNTPARRSSLIRSNDDFIRDLCSGDLEKTLKLVPSRELARELGVSDIQLRREIYLARQRVLNKRPVPKKRKRIENFREDVVNDIINFDVPTCASPPSSSSNTMPPSQEEFREFDFINDEDCLMVEDEADDGWTVVKGWLNYDLIDY